MHFAYRAVTFCGGPFQALRLCIYLVTPRGVSSPLRQNPTTPRRQRLQAWHRRGLGCSLFAHRYWGNRFCFLFLGVLRCFSSPRWPGQGYVFTLPCMSITPCRLPHSEIPGSKPVWRLPEAYRSLPRLSSPSDAKASTVCP